MPRRREPPRLYLDPARHVWIIRDSQSFVRTGCPEERRDEAEKQLAQYLALKHKPESGPNPLIADVLLVYAQEHVPHTRTAHHASYHISTLAAWWGSRRVADITAASCREYSRKRPRSSARRELQVLRAAVRFYNREYRALDRLPTFSIPPAGEARTRWLTRSEAARFLWAARYTQHLKRFILLGLYTGSRSNNILGLKWSAVDLAAGIMRRRAWGEAESATKKAPEVRLGRRILSHLRRWKRLDGAGHDAYVCHYNGRRIGMFRTSWFTALARAGLDDKVTPHTLRHTRATWLMHAGVDAWEAAGHLGMTVTTLTRTYAKHHPDWQKRAAEV